MNFRVINNHNYQLLKERKMEKRLEKVHVIVANEDNEYMVVLNRGPYGVHVVPNSMKLLKNIADEKEKGMNCRVSLSLAYDDLYHIDKVYFTRKEET